ncbi:MAG: RNA polymerase sigma factor [Eubacterium sp.]|nr:RNA polymerase sigma factor [Eubacterium sp.]
MKDITQFISDYGKDIYSFCVYLTRNKYDADDLYQQTFLIAMEKAEIRDDDNPKSYLISIAANVWNNQKRKHLWRKKKADIIYYQEEEYDFIPDGKESVEDLIIKKDEADLIRSVVIRLPEKFRVVLLMFYMESMSIDEISNALDIPEGTVKSRLHQAKKTLKERLNI